MPENSTLSLHDALPILKKNSVLAWSVVVALGGFLFGFDTAVISGAEKSIQQYWNLSVFEHGLTISIALIGTVIGDRKSTRLNSSHLVISYAVFCLKKKI